MGGRVASQTQDAFQCFIACSYFWAATNVFPLSPGFFCKKVSPLSHCLGQWIASQQVLKEAKKVTYCEKPIKRIMFPEKSFCPVTGLIFQMPFGFSRFQDICYVHICQNHLLHLWWDPDSEIELKPMSAKSLLKKQVFES